jgi:hypothetical protein
MAQTIEYWQNKMLEKIATDPELVELSQNKSMVAIYRLMTFVVAACISMFEQVIDVFRKEVDMTVEKPMVGHPQWIKDKVFAFQYSATNPQVIQLVNLIPRYPTIDPALRIVTRCSVLALPNGRVAIKTAKNEPPEVLSAPELNRLSDYLLSLMPAGVSCNVISIDPDKLYLKAQIHHKGEYTSVITANVINAIKDFLSSKNKFDFNGFIRISNLQDAIQAVEGVTDVVLIDVAARKWDILFTDKTFYVQDQDVLKYKFQTFAGYIIEETEPGQSFIDTLLFKPHSNLNEED